MTTTRPHRRMFIISSLSGAGRTTALGVLSDLGFQASDSVPLMLWPDLVVNTGNVDIALGWPIAPEPADTSVDPRSVLARLPDDVAVTHLFLSAETETLRRRYSETRRAHPFDNGRGLMAALAAEQQASLPRRALADEIVDTTGTKLSELRANLMSRVGPGTDALQIRTLSFSYRLGLPQDADMVFDVRWLRNPHYDPDLRPLTGQDGAVGNYIREDKDFSAFAVHLRHLLEFTAGRQRREGKAYFTLAFGCTGGKHRSVFFAEQAGEWLAEAGYDVSIQHRDVQTF